MKTIALAVISTLFLAACQDSDKTTKKHISPVVEENTNTESDIISLEEASLQLINKRVVELYPDLSNLDNFARRVNHHNLIAQARTGKLPGGSLNCRKETALAADKEAVAYFTSLGTEAKLELRIESFDKDEVKYNCEIRNAEGTTLQTFEHVLRKSYVIDRTENIQSIGAKEIDTLVLMKGSELLFGDSTTTLKVKMLVSDGAEISTFPVYDLDKTEDNRDGQSGGSIRISAEQAYGQQLTLNLRGKNAGAQTNVPAQPAQAQAGADGNCDSRGRKCDGKNGYPGLPAIKGFTGFTGGSTGHAEISLEEKTDLEVIFNYQPGLASAGGKPGKPGLGGRGGKGDSTTIQDTCSDMARCQMITVSGKDGAQGALGAIGEDGDSGEHGFINTSLYQNRAESVRESVNSSWSSRRGEL